MFTAFQRLLNPNQVYSLLEGGPLSGYVKLAPPPYREEFPPEFVEVTRKLFVVVVFYSFV